MQVIGFRPSLQHRKGTVSSGTSASSRLLKINVFNAWRSKENQKENKKTNPGFVARNNRKNQKW
jgi:hypothetical protein